MSQRLTARARQILRESSPGYSLAEIVVYVTVASTLAAFVLPFTRTTLNAMNLSGDARSVASAVSLAKMRASADFTHVRVRIDLGPRTFGVERWQRATNSWVPEGTTRTLSPTVNFGFLTIAAPPPNTQPAIGQATPCNDNAGVAIAGTACIVFNSRGVPIDVAQAPTATGAFYVNDGATVFGVTASAGGSIRTWRSGGNNQWSPY